MEASYSKAQLRSTPARNTPRRSGRRRVAIVLLLVARRAPRGRAVAASTASTGLAAAAAGAAVAAVAPLSCTRNIAKRARTRVP